MSQHLRAVADGAVDLSRLGEGDCYPELGAHLLRSLARAVPSKRWSKLRALKRIRTYDEQESEFDHHWRAGARQGPKLGVVTALQRSTLSIPPSLFNLSCWSCVSRPLRAKGPETPFELCSELMLLVEYTPMLIVKYSAEWAESQRESGAVDDEPVGEDKLLPPFDNDHGDDMEGLTDWMERATSRQEELRKEEREMERLLEKIEEERKMEREGEADEKDEIEEDSEATEVNRELEEDEWVEEETEEDREEEEVGDSEKEVLDEDKKMEEDAESREKGSQEEESQEEESQEEEIEDDGATMEEDAHSSVEHPDRTEL